jgi:hypothetical protein
MEFFQNPLNCMLLGIAVVCFLIWLFPTSKPKDASYSNYETGVLIAREILAKYSVEVCYNQLAVTREAFRDFPPEVFQGYRQTVLAAFQAQGETK